MGYPKIGLALSGGGVRGFAHIGVLKVFEREGIPIGCISGTSMGGIIAAAYASGTSLAVLEERANNFSNIRELMKLVDLTPARRGLLDGSHVRAYLGDMFPESLTFEGTKIPLSLNAVDLIKGREVTLCSGPLFPAVQATCAVPGIFPPVTLGDYRLIDGGILNNVPVEQTKELGADITIAINAQVDPCDEDVQVEIPIKINFPIPLPEYFIDLYWAGFIMVSRITHTHMQQYPPDIYVYPRLSPDITMFFGFRRAREIIEAGEAAAIAVLPDIFQRIADYSR